MPGSVLQGDFTAGELAPSLAARVDLAKYTKGCRTLTNFLVQAHGGAVKRPGFEMLDALPGEAVLIPFVFSQEQTYCLVFGEKWLRVATPDGFILNGDGEIYQIPSPYTLAQAKQLSYVQSADVLFLAVHGVVPTKLKRLGHASWQFEAMVFTSPIDAPANQAAVKTNGDAVTPYTYYVTAVNADGKESGLPAGVNINGPASNNWVASCRITVSWSAVTGAVEYRIYKASYGGRPGFVAEVSHGTATGGTVSGLKVGAKTASLVHYSGSITRTRVVGNGHVPSSDSTSSLSVAANASQNAFVVDDLAFIFVTKTTTTTTWTSHTEYNPGSDEYETVWTSSTSTSTDKFWCLITFTGANPAGTYGTYSTGSLGSNAAYPSGTVDVYTVSPVVSGGSTLSWDDRNVTPSTTEGAPVYDDPFPNGDYPGAVCLYEQRLVFASSPNRPQTIWMSKSGDYGNFATYKPAAADTPIELTIASQEVSPVNWLMPLRSLILGMGGMEWEIGPRGDSAFSASNAKATPQSYWGSSLRRAIIIGNVILHVSASGRQVRSLQYEFAADSYNGSDLSIMAAHLLEAGRIVDWTYAKAPDSIVWAVREDGVLLGLTFQAEHQIAAWHKHTTQGRFKAVCAIPNGFEDALFAVVERNGALYLERAAARYLSGDPTGAVFMDAALTYSGEPVTRLSGLDHLEGMEVGIFADGAVQPPRTVENGAVTLDNAASVVTVGLLYTADLETMPVEVVAQTGTSVAQKKQINAVNVLFRDSLGVKVGLSFDEAKMQAVKWRTTEPYGHPPAPYSGLKSVTVPSLADNIVTVCIRSDMPTPVTVLALVSRIAVNQ